jgi:aryl sulfotransferase
MQSQETIDWPHKKREVQHRLLDSTVWNEFRFRPSDIVIATYAKSGTTWMQQIVGQLIFGSREDIDVWTISPWLDRRPTSQKVLAALVAQSHRRFVKTHLPADALPFSHHVRYVYVARDGRDVVASLYNHHANFTDEWYREINDAPARLGPPMPRPPASLRRYFREWLERDGYPFWPFFAHVRSWWELRFLPNVLLVHFSDLKADLPSEIRRIAAFLEISLSDRILKSVVRHSSFRYMKAHAASCAPEAGRFWKGGARTFIHKGTNGRWREELTLDDCRCYETAALKHLGRACANWLAHGGTLRAIGA